MYLTSVPMLLHHLWPSGHQRITPAFGVKPPLQTEPEAAIMQLFVHPGYGLHRSFIDTLLGDTPIETKMALQQELMAYMGSQSANHTPRSTAYPSATMVGLECTFTQRQLDDALAMLLRMQRVESTRQDVYHLPNDRIAHWLRC